MVNPLKMEFQRQLFQRITFSLCDVSGFLHLVENGISTSACAFVSANWIKVRGILAHTYQRGCFFDGQCLRCLPEIDRSCRLDSNSVIKEIKLVQVHIDDFLFGIIPLQLYGNYPFDGLLEQSFHKVISAWRE